jgi:hypothetical protein
MVLFIRRQSSDTGISIQRHLILRDRNELKYPNYDSWQQRNRKFKTKKMKFLVIRSEKYSCFVSYLHWSEYQLVNSELEIKRL